MCGRARWMALSVKHIAAGPILLYSQALSCTGDRKLEKKVKKRKKSKKKNGKKEEKYEKFAEI